MKIGIVAEGPADVAVLCNILRGRLDLDGRISPPNPVLVPRYRSACPLRNRSATVAPVDIPESGEDFDLILRHVTRHFPEHLARALLPEGAVITSTRWFETQMTSRQRRLDRGLLVEADGKTRLEHTEWQVEMTADMPFRLYEYNFHASLALVAETPAGEEPPRIQTTVVLLSGRETPWPEHGEYRTSPDDQRFSGLSYRVDAVYQQTVAELTARGPLWSIFAPLAVDADPVRMAQVVADLRAAHPPRDFAELAAALMVMATKDKRQRGLRQGILAVLTEEDVMESSVYEMGVKRGEQTGERRGELKGELRGKLEGELKVLLRAYERQLRRALTESERDAIKQRLTTLGADRVFDVQTDLSPEALAAWLADPAAS